MLKYLLLYIKFIIIYFFISHNILCDFYIIILYATYIRSDREWNSAVTRNKLRLEYFAEYWQKILPTLRGPLDASISNFPICLDHSSIFSQAMHHL